MPGWMTTTRSPLEPQIAVAPDDHRPSERLVIRCWEPRNARGWYNLEGTLPAYKVGRRWQIGRADLERWIVEWSDPNQMSPKR